jgi:hypothetical protein
MKLPTSHSFYTLEINRKCERNRIMGYVVNVNKAQRVSCVGLELSRGDTSPATACPQGTGTDGKHTVHPTSHKLVRSGFAS